MIGNHMAPKGTLSPKAAWLSLPERWPTLAVRHPEFVAVLGHLGDTLRKLFVRTFKTVPQSLAVYGLGRMCVEDFIEILFLVENGFDMTGIKLLRGLYERAITAEIISVDKGDAELFYNYHAINAYKAHQRAKAVYKDQWRPKSIQEDVAWYEKVKCTYNMERCATCKRPLQLGWSPDSLEALAEKVGKIFAKRYSRERQSHFRDLYLACAEMPNPHIHASMFSIFSRLQENGNYLAHKDDYREQGIIATSTAHALMSLVVETQDRFFDLGFSDDLQHVYADFEIAWPVLDLQP